MMGVSSCGGDGENGSLLAGGSLESRLKSSPNDMSSFCGVEVSVGVDVGRLFSMDGTFPGGSRVLSGMWGACTGEVVEGVACFAAVGGAIAKECWRVWISESCDMSFWR